MESRAKIFGHPIHQMLIVFPLGLLATSVIFDLIYLITGNGYWTEMAFWLIAAGVAGGLLAAPFGLIDWLAIPKNTRAKSIGILHAITNVVVLGLFTASWFLRRETPNRSTMLAMGISFFACILSSIAAWFGGELVVRLGVGVDNGANLNAPNSLSGKIPDHSPQRVEDKPTSRYAA